MLLLCPVSLLLAPQTGDAPRANIQSTVCPLVGACCAVSRLGWCKVCCSSCSAEISVCHPNQLAHKHWTPRQHPHQAMLQTPGPVPAAATAAGACSSRQPQQTRMAAGAAQHGQPRDQQQQHWLRQPLVTLAVVQHQHGRSLLPGPIQPAAAAAGWARPSSSGSGTCSRSHSSSSTGCCKLQKLSRCVRTFSDQAAPYPAIDSARLLQTVSVLS
jgi:hypothetical protein